MSISAKTLALLGAAASACALALTDGLVETGSAAIRPMPKPPTTLKLRFPDLVVALVSDDRRSFVIRNAGDGTARPFNIHIASGSVTSVSFWGGFCSYQVPAAVARVGVALEPGRYHLVRLPSLSTSRRQVTLDSDREVRESDEANNEVFLPGFPVGC